MQEIQNELSRKAFLRGAVKLFALSSVVYTAAECHASGEIPVLRGLSQQQYLNLNAIAEVFFEGTPVPNFDAGKAFDDYLFGHPTELDTVGIALELADAPSSILAALVLDGSLTPLVKLPKEDRLKRMTGWKNSDNPMKTGLYNILKQTVFFLITSDPTFVTYTGYDLTAGLIPYSK